MNHLKQILKKHLGLLIQKRVRSKSDTDKYHIVRLYSNGNISCSCIAGQMQQYCSHKKKFLKELTKKHERNKRKIS